jgi:RNA polymerase I-specific transcription initiation factor RRN3
LRPQIVRVSVLDLIGNLVVSNVAFTHTCLQLLVYSFLPPPSPPVPDEDIGAWVISDDAAIVQAAVLSTLEKVRILGGRMGSKGGSA